MEEPDDPFVDLVLDDDFVAEATHHEPVGDERIARAAALRERLERARAEQVAARRHRVPMRGLAVGLAALIVLSAVGLGLTHTDALKPRLVAAHDDSATAALLDSGGGPTPSPPESTTPLGTPVATPSDPGARAFEMNQPGRPMPVAYDPCRPIHTVVNNTNAPPGGAALVQQAVAEMRRITGLHIDIEGTTDEVPTTDRASFQPNRYGNRWAPVLIAWTDPGAVTELAGPVAGLGGSVAVAPGGSGPRVYVSGIVFLDGPQLQRSTRTSGDESAARATILHEFGHLLGLGHVSDRSQLMYPESTGRVTEPQSGDIAGLVELGRGRCFDRL